MTAVTLSSAITLADARAAGEEGRKTTVVARIFYGDLDLRTARGAQQMWLRIDRAAAHACGLNPNHLVLRAAGDARRCRLALSSNAVVSLDAPLVTTEFQRVYGPRRVLTANR